MLSCLHVSNHRSLSHYDGQICFHYLSGSDDEGIRMFMERQILSNFFTHA